MVDGRQTDRQTDRRTDIHLVCRRRNLIAPTVAHTSVCSLRSLLTSFLHACRRRVTINSCSVALYDSVLQTYHLRFPQSKITAGLVPHHDDDDQQQLWDIQ